MLNMLQSAIRSSWISLLLVGSILAGSLIGHVWPSTGEALGGQVDRTLLALVGLLFFGVRFEAVAQLRGSARVLALGTALIPISMVVQLLLYPVYLHLFTRSPVEVEAGIIGDTLLHWFLAPFVAAVLAHYGLRGLLGNERFGRLLDHADRLTPWLIAALVMEIFAANIAVILEHRILFAWVLLAVFLFFVLTYFLGEGISRLARLAHPEHALLTMSIAARNAPLMLAVTMAALPDQPLIYAALIIGMLVEFPHLTVLQRVLLGQRRRARSPIPAPARQS